MAGQIHEPLPGPGLTRFIEFLPSNSPDILNLALRVASLDSEPYVAVSYVWGDPAATIDITCNGLPLKITRNLFCTLQRVKKYSSTLRVWADGISIWQACIAERNQQVAMMGEIYRHARSVLVCIHGSDPGPSDVKSLAHDVNTLIGSSRDWRAMDSLSDDDPILLDPRWNSAAVFKQSPWFSRAWVIQEVAMARDPRILYGDCDISFRDWALLEMWANHKAPQLRRRWNLVAGTIHPQAVDWYRQDIPHNTSFIGIVCVMGRLGCANPRDHIYSLLAYPRASLPGQTGPIVTPEYAMPVDDVFYNFSVQILKLPDGMRLLSAVSHRSKGPQESHPSWALSEHLFGLDLTDEGAISLGISENHYYNASLGLGDSYHAIVEGRGLQLYGVYLDRIASVFALGKQDFEIPSPGNHHDGCENGADLLESLYSTVTDARLPSPYGSHQGRRDAFSVTLRAGMLRGGDVPSYRPDFDAYWEARQRGRASSQEESKYNRGAVLRTTMDMQDWTARRSFFITDKGYVGLCPKIARPGDTCIVFCGGFTPFVIRPRSSDMKFQMVGECYIHGIMTGELSKEIAAGSLALQHIILY